MTHAFEPLTGVFSVFVRIVTILQVRWRIRVLDATPEGKRHNLHKNRDHPIEWLPAAFDAS
jgi:hypothetical protein